MSGGHYGHIAYRLSAMCEPEHIVDDADGALPDIANFLANPCYDAADAAAEIRELIRMIERLHDVFVCVDRIQSGDGGDIDEALASYRKRKETR